LHIERAFRHLTQGQDEHDDQAFEGSIKEAYRVLAGKNPERKTPHEIESYLAQNNLFRSRVLAQFTAYRTEWRNPAAHDYTLSFDGSEAFVAIATVSAFASVLIDQIAERLAYNQVVQKAEVHGHIPQKDDDEPARLMDVLVYYLMLFNRTSRSLPILTDEQLVGSVRGFLSGLPPLFQVTAQATIAKGREEQVDLLVSHGDEQVMIVLKRSNTRGAVRQGVLRLEHAIAVSGIRHAILYCYHPSGVPTHRTRPFMNGEVSLIVPVVKDDETALRSELDAASEEGSRGTLGETPQNQGLESQGENDSGRVAGPDGGSPRPANA
jgi:hypothetical protein